MWKLITFKLTDHDRACMDALSRHLGQTRAGILRLSYRALAAKEGVALPVAPPKDAANGVKNKSKKVKKKS